MMILGLIGTLAVYGAIIGAGILTSSQIAKHFDTVAKGIGSKNRRRLEGELDKLAGLLLQRTGKADVAAQKVALNDILLQELTRPGGLATGGVPDPESPESPLAMDTGAQGGEAEAPPLGPIGGLEVDEGDILSEELGVSRQEVQQAARPPLPPALAMFGGPKSPDDSGAVLP